MFDVPIPAPMLFAGVELPKLGLSPHSNQAVVFEPLGLTVPVSVAPSPDTALACAVVTAGGNGTVELKST
jgi:peptidase E